jgi:hypothetical protein
MYRRLRQVCAKPCANAHDKNFENGLEGEGGDGVPWRTWP